ncbi:MULTISPECIES: hypothetical protein [unclassified Solwaraspora]|uniref:hypothetical protein n=1 Tax=unclassified Solwaraspora TaxID=2627926 RepID=UPI00248BB957|nr:MULTISPECIES: hypothetical protein [unclassified Solwaraspora]WBB98920.1 hypothetical protein O7553_08570 [Solwaraspora sp. WMMA2059]WBC22527.1 hypothetical protein O7543_08795 [Solwaraspora sp. WMMA2080]WJK35419.1 hypothetical protein O7610_03295 [Solwaraspora sp. WMMA2065]
MTVTIVDAGNVPWVNGEQVYDSMEPAFRDNFGGDPDQVRELLSRYWMRSLWLDRDTTRRIDHIRAVAGYRDLSEAYHDSVEEAYFLDGVVDLSAEGRLIAGDYFWRPPGWVHKASSDEGFTAILCMEGAVATEGSDRVTRVVCPDDQAGVRARANGAAGAADDVGPRGYLRRVESRQLPWAPLTARWSGVDAEVVGLPSPDTGPTPVGRPLSRNVVTGACSALVRLPAGYTGTPQPVDRERFLVTTTGTLTVAGQPLTACSLIHLPAGATPPPIVADTDVELFVKIGEATA